LTETDRSNEDSRVIDPTPSSAAPTSGRDVEHDGPILLYDGVCSFCNGTVRFILRHDRKGTMRFAPLQGPTGELISVRYPAVRKVDSLILVRAPDTAHESVAIRSNAVLEIAEYLGGVWRLALLGRVIPPPVRDWGYGLFARFRYKLFGRYATCPVPTPEERARFLP